MRETRWWEKLELKNLKEKIITDKQTQHCSDAELVFFLSRAAGKQPAAHASESSWATPPDLTLQIMIRAANPSQAPKVRDGLYLWGFSTTGLFLVRRDFKSHNSVQLVCLNKLCVLAASSQESIGEGS